MKVSKEGIVGLVAAVKKYLRTDQTIRLLEWDNEAKYLVSELSGFKSVAVRKITPVNVDHPRPMIVPRVEIEPLSSNLTADILEKELLKGDLPIYAYTLEGKLYINPQCLLEGDEMIVAKRVSKLLEDFASMN